MRLTAPCKAIEFDAQSVNGEFVKLSDYRGKAILLCFFRDTARPLRNRRVFELTRNYKAWRKVGVEVIVVFNESKHEVNKFFAKHPRPFPVIADPELELYRKYGIERVVGHSMVSPLLKLPAFMYKLFRGRLARFNPFGRIMPADFLINFDGIIVDTWYGKNELDHMPFERLERFVMAMRVEMRKKVMSASSVVA